MVDAWLWFEGGGVFSHKTALSLHGLSEALPKQLHLTPL
jgi:predicted transcriptional regulator of viral defense system